MTHPRGRIVPPPYWKTRRPWGRGNDGETTSSGDENVCLLRLQGHAHYVEEVDWVLSTKLSKSSMPVGREKTKTDEERETKKPELGICRIKDKQKNSTVGSGSLVRNCLNDGRCCLVTTDRVVPPKTELKQLVLEFKKTKSNSDKVEVVKLSEHACMSDIRRRSGLVVIPLNENKFALKESSIFSYRPFFRGDEDCTPLVCPTVDNIDHAKPFVVKEFQLELGHDHKGGAVLHDLASDLRFKCFSTFIGTSSRQPHGAVVLNGNKEAVGVLYESDDRISLIRFSQTSFGKSNAFVQSACKRM